MRVFTAITFSLLLAMASAEAAPLPHQVDIPLGDSVLHAQLYRPDGTGPFPVVIALHGCGGLAGQSDPVQSRYHDWADQLLRRGTAVLLPDSYGSRELGPQCQGGEPKIRAPRERGADIMASRQGLLQQPPAARGRINLFGWGKGARAGPAAGGPPP